MKNLSKKFQIQIDLSLEDASFDVRVYNASPRKGFVDLEKIKERLKDVFAFMQHEGLHTLMSQIENEQLH